MVSSVVAASPCWYLRAGSRPEQLAQRSYPLAIHCMLGSP